MRERLPRQARPCPQRDGDGRFRSWQRAKLIETWAELHKEVHGGRIRVRQHDRAKSTDPPEPLTLLASADTDPATPPKDRAG